MSRWLKPDRFAALIVRAEARTYLRSNGKSKSKINGNGKSKSKINGNGKSKSKINGNGKSKSKSNRGFLHSIRSFAGANERIPVGMTSLEE